MRGCKFLLDRDVQKAKDCFPRKRVFTAEEAGLSDDAPDSAVGRRAFDLDAVIVAGNGEDFIRESIEFQRKLKSRGYGFRGVRGLIVVSRGIQSQRRQISS